jgi:hypothetical protein
MQRCLFTSRVLTRGVWRDRAGCASVILIARRDCRVCLSRNAIGLVLLRTSEGGDSCSSRATAWRTKHADSSIALLTRCVEASEVMEYVENELPDVTNGAYSDRRNIQTVASRQRLNKDRCFGRCEPTRTPETSSNAT